VVPDADFLVKPVKTSRRGFLSFLSVATGIVGSIVVAIPVVGFFLAPVFKKPPGTWQVVGAVQDFEVGKIVEVEIEDSSTVPWTGVTAKTGAWLHRKSDTEFVAFTLNCSHLGCPVRWEAGAQLFMCPCHGGVYYIDGVVAAGPPPRPLQQYPARVRNGKVQVRSSPIPISS
jgi:menaquinol-cytochrome c reductase iron-sulfur subunit